MLVDQVSTLNLYLRDGASFVGAINAAGAKEDEKGGDIYVELSDNAKWTLTDDSYITSLTCDADSIDLNGHTLYVDGETYAAGTAASGSAVEAKALGGQDGFMPGNPPDGKGGPGMGNPPDGQGGNPPSGERPSDMPELPDGEAPNGNPPDGNPPDGGQNGPGMGNPPDGRGGNPPSGR